VTADTVLLGHDSVSMGNSSQCFKEM